MRAGSSRSTPGERPTAVTVAAILAALLVVANAVVYVAGWDVQGSQPSLRGTLDVQRGARRRRGRNVARRKYWAVLGFEMLLAITIILTAAVAAARVELARRSCSASPCSLSAGRCSGS